MNRVKQFANLPFIYHLVAGLFIRLALILYGDYHDRNYELPFTDVDYKVFTDAARHVLKGNSPYKRHTYRYSPIIAFLLTPNIVISQHFGKVLFSIFDIFISIAVKKLVEHQIGKDKNAVSRISTYCALFWLYNPMSIGISTRGNADSVPCFFIILSLMFLQTDVVRGLAKYAIAGVLLGISIHLRMYPLAFSFPLYLSLGEYKITRRTGFKDGTLALIPNVRQVVLTLSCVTTLVLLTYGMYVLYRYEFLFETYIYHLFRKDTKHNFSVLFYYSYLTMDQLAFDMVKKMTQILEFIVLFVISLVFGCEAQTLPFALFCQAVVLVAFNSVMTSQYFVWFLSLLPLVVHNFRLRLSHAGTLAALWAVAQGAWLFYAFMLEFKSNEVFILIWIKSVLLFSSHVFILGQLIKSYSPCYGFGQISDVAKTK